MAEGKAADPGAARAPGRVLLNRTELAGAFKVALPTINRWLERGMPHVQPGGQGRQWLFDLEDCKSWRDQELERLTAEEEAKRTAIAELQAELDLREVDDDDAERLPLKLQEQYYRVDKVREERARARGFLVETAKVRRDLDRCFAYLADRLQALPDYLERRCALDPEVVDELGQAVDEFQAELARQMQQEELDDQRDFAA